MSSNLQAPIQVAYTLTWQISEPVPLRTSEHPRQQTGRKLYYRAGRKTCGDLGETAVAAAAAMLKHLQSRQPGLAHAHADEDANAEPVSFFAGVPDANAPCGEGGPQWQVTNAIAVQSTAAVLRVAATEAPDRLFRFTATDTADSAISIATIPQILAENSQSDAHGVHGTHGAHDTHGTYGTYGCTLVGQAVRIPRLLPAFSPYTAQQAHTSGSSGGGSQDAADMVEPVLPAASSWRHTVVSGGLGGLGILAALWLAWQGAGSIALLGRSGRYVVDFRSRSAYSLIQDLA